MRRQRRHVPPLRFCVDCGVRVGRHWRPYVLCEGCRKERLAEAARRHAERLERFAQRERD